MSAPLTKTGAFGFVPGIFAAMIGAQRPPTLFKKLAIPVPVPLFGAAIASGVYAYSTPYMMFWKKASTEEKPSWNLESAEMVKRKRKIPESIVETAIVPLRPMYLISTV